MNREIRHHIFLSYSRRDTAVMQRLRADLRAVGLSVWTDENLEPGSRAWETAIANAIRGAGCVVVLLSPDAEQSMWVGRELAYAETLNVRIFPLLVRGSESEAVPLRLISHQWVDARQNYDLAMHTMTMAISGYMQGQLVTPGSAEDSGVRARPPAPPADAEAVLVPDIKPIWQFRMNAELRGSPVAFNHGVFVGSYDRHLYAVQAKTGQPVWKFAAKGGITTAPVVVESQQRVMFGSEDSGVYALDCRTGKLAWSFLAGNQIHGGPCIAYDRVFFGSDDGSIYALNLSNGRLQRSYPLFAPVRTRPLVTDDLLIFGLDSGEVIALELSGTQKWKFRARGRIAAAPVLAPDRQHCYVASADNYVYALETRTGYADWRFRSGGSVVSSPAYSAGMIYFGSMDSKVYALSVTGSQKWEFKTRKPIVAPPLAHDGALYVGSTDNTFYCLDAGTGQELWHYTAPSAIAAEACIANDKVLFGTLDGTLFALPLKVSAPV